MGNDVRRSSLPHPPWPRRRRAAAGGDPSASPAGSTPRTCSTSPAPRTSSARTSRTSTSPSSPAAREERAARDRRRGPARHACTRAASSPTRTRSRCTDRELQLIAQGPEHAHWLLLECPFAGLDDDFDAAVERLTALGYGLLLAHPERVSTATSSRLAPHIGDTARCCRSTSPACSATTARDARRIARAPGPQTGRVYCLAADTHPGTREEIAPARRRCAAPRSASATIQAFRLTQSNPRFLLREGNPRLALPQTEDRTNSTR